MVIVSLPEDKPKIAFHAAMMVVENFGFFVMYHDLWGSAPVDAACDDTRAIVAFMAMTCFSVAFLCLFMGMGGFTNDKLLFPIGWFSHLAGGLCYCFCTAAIPIIHFGEKGKECSAILPTYGDRLSVVYYMHAVLFLFYVYSMLSITYFSFLKPTYFTGGTVTNLTSETSALLPPEQQEYGTAKPPSGPKKV